MSDRVAVVPITSIKESVVALRTVDKESESFIGLRDSIAQIGLTSPVSVREKTEEVDGKPVKVYELCDGLHRFTACQQAGLQEIPVIIKSLTDTQALEAQIMANVHKVETRPVEYAKQLVRIFTATPTMTVAEMASKLAKSTTWVTQRLGLTKLNEGVGKLVDDGKIAISNAVALSKLPNEEQVKLVDAAMTQDATEFVTATRARASELRKAAKEGRQAGELKFEPTARLQKLSILKGVLDDPKFGSQLCQQNGVKTPDAGFLLGIQWALNLDPASVAAQKAKAEARVQAREEAKKKRELDRAKKKADEAAATAAKLAETG